MRKRTNALRRKYQRTRHNAELREACKTRYFEEKARYAATNATKPDHGRNTVI
jgi:hypothetical protein